MNKPTKKIVIWESVVGGLIFLILLILSIAKIISFIYLFVGVIVIIILSSVVITIAIVLKKKAREEVNEEENYIKDIEAKLIAKQKLFDPDILEYEKELLYEKVGNYGISGNEIPVYIRKMIGEFENSTLVVLVNMKNKQTSFKFYDDVKMSQADIDADIEKDANLLVKSPAPTPRLKVTEESSPLTGITKITKEPVEKEIKKEEEGDLS